MTLLITGDRGFVGSYLCKKFDTKGLSTFSDEHIDLLDVPRLRIAIKAAKPDSVIHLAAQTFVPDSIDNPNNTYEANFIGTQNLLQALRDNGFKGRFLFVSTADIYGSLHERLLPAAESSLVRPLNPYAVSKAAAELLCGYWHRAEGMDLVIARPFNHIGPGQSPRFALADFSKIITEIKLGRRNPVIAAGDLDVTRDFTDVRDIIEAYMLLLKKGVSGEIYNVCTGEERNLRVAVQQLAELAGVHVTIQTDPSRLRKASQRRAFGSNKKLREETGWHPTIEWETSLKDMLDHWEKTLQ